MHTSIPVTGNPPHHLVQLPCVGRRAVSSGIDRLKLLPNILNNLPQSISLLHNSHQIPSLPPFKHSPLGQRHKQTGNDQNQACQGSFDNRTHGGITGVYHS